MSALSTSGVLVRRHLPFERNFVMVPNAWARDRRLSWRARAILTYLMSHQAGWSVTLKTLAADAADNAERKSDGLSAVRGAVGELERVGYLKREQKRDRQGRLSHTEWVICDPFEPVDNSAPLVGSNGASESTYPQEIDAESAETPDENRDAINRYRLAPTTVPTDVGSSNDIRTPSTQENSLSRTSQNVGTEGITAASQDRSEHCSRSMNGHHEFDTASGWCLHACGEREPSPSEPIGAHA